TDDLPSLQAAVTEIEQQSTGVAGSVDYLRRQEAFAQAFLDTLPPEKLAGRELTGQTLFDIVTDAEFALYQFKRKTNELQALMRSISGTEGRKILLFATNDFGNYAGARGYRTGFVPVSHRGGLDTRPLREAVARTANEHGITVYPLYPIGLEWTPRSTAMESRADIYEINQTQDAMVNARDNEILLNQTSALDELADETGGLMAWGSKDIAQLLPNVVEDLNSYYSLAYRTPATGTTKSRDIVVTTKNPDYTVRTRREYVEKTDVTRMKDRVIANLYHQDEPGRLPIEVTIGKITKKSRTRWTAPLRIHVPVNALITRENQGTFSVFIATGGVIGIMSEVQQRAQQFKIDPNAPADSHFTYEFTLEFNGATDTVSVGVLDEVSKEYGLDTIELPAYGTEDEQASTE
ncbi:MAG: hypothetical protein ACLGH0_15050, partial [Thermoanaerobaculia bacterium]